MKCSFCGNEVEKGMKYCPLCGAEVKEETPENQTPEMENHDEPNNDYSYGQSSSDPNGGYSYGQSSSDPNGGYSYGQKDSNPNSSFNYGGKSGNGHSQFNNGQPEKQISGTPYIIFSILVTLCCCLPLGIVSIVYASKINSLQNAGDYEGAKAAAKKAKIFMIIGAVGGLIASVGLFATGYVSDSTTVQTVENMLDEDADTTDSRDDVTETDDKETTKELVTANEDLGDSWKSYTVQINDKVLTFPCTKADIEAAGLSMDTEYTAENYMVNANEYELVYFMDANDNEIMAYAINNTDTAMEVKDCLIGGVSVDDYDLENGGLTVIFPGGLQMGASKDAVTGAYGEADDTYDGDSLSMYSWYSGDSYYKSCEIDFDAESGLVCMMTMQNFGQ